MCEVKDEIELQKGQIIETQREEITMPRDAEQEKDESQEGALHPTLQPILN